MSWTPKDGGDQSPWGGNGNGKKKSNNDKGSFSENEYDNFINSIQDKLKCAHSDNLLTLALPSREA